LSSVAGKRCDWNNNCVANTCQACGDEWGPVCQQGDKCKGVLVPTNGQSIPPNTTPPGNCGNFNLCIMCNAEPIPSDPIWACSLQEAEQKAKQNADWTTCSVGPGPCIGRQGIDPVPSGGKVLPQ
jgi:hypothetical protein